MAVFKNCRTQYLIFWENYGNMHHKCCIFISNMPYIGFIYEASMAMKETLRHWVMGLAVKQLAIEDHLYNSIFLILNQKNVLYCSFFFCCLMFLFFAKGNNTIEWLIAARCVHATTQSILKIHQPASGFVSAGFKWWVMVRW